MRSRERETETERDRKMEVKRERVEREGEERKENSSYRTDNADILYTERFGPPPPPNAESKWDVSPCCTVLLVRCRTFTFPAE